MSHVLTRRQNAARRHCPASWSRFPAISRRAAARSNDVIPFSLGWIYWPSPAISAIPSLTKTVLEPTKHKPVPRPTPCLKFCRQPTVFDTLHEPAAVGLWPWPPLFPRDPAHLYHLPSPPLRLQLPPFWRPFTLRNVHTSLRFCLGPKLRLYYLKPVFFFGVVPRVGTAPPPLNTSTLHFPKF